MNNHKYISTQSSKILSTFNFQDQNYFETSEAAHVLVNSSRGAVRELLSGMVKRGLLLRLKKGLYYIIPYEREAESYMPDWHLIAGALAKGVRHYIGYYSALEIHNLITQPSLKQQIVVSKQIKPSKIIIKGITFQFVYHNENHFFGEKEIWINSFDRVKSSDMEKTIVDCLFKPDYAGGIVEVGKAIHMSQEKLDFQKLLEYTERFKSQAVIKRLGFLLETLEIKTGIITKLNKRKTDAYVLLDIELPQAGKFISRWSVQQNLDTETLKKAITT